jgi:hypothetical protein
MCRLISYLIIARNVKCNEFYCVKNLLGIGKEKIQLSEKTINEMISKGYKFYTKNPTTNKRTKIISINSQIKTKKNNTELDNLINLPVEL